MAVTRGRTASICMQASSYPPDNGSDSSACAGTPCGRRWRDRVRVTDDGQVVLQLRHQWIDGTTHVVFDPVEFLGRLAVLVPRPRINLMLYHGVLAPRAAWRSEVVRRQTSGVDSDAEVTDADAAETARRHARGQCWASLMARTLGHSAGRLYVQRHPENDQHAGCRRHGDRRR